MHSPSVTLPQEQTRLRRVPSKVGLHAKNASPKPSPVLREWPSIVPAAPEDFYIVVNHYGRFGTAFAETDLDRANYETTIADLISGQHWIRCV